MGGGLNSTVSDVGFVDVRHLKVAGWIVTTTIARGSLGDSCAISVIATSGIA
jgi:hypothetical protein